MILELLRPLSFLLSAFFVRGARWEERLAMALLRVTPVACIRFGSGLLSTWHAPNRPAGKESMLSTQPVRMFFCAIGGMVVLFALSWGLDAYFVPLLRHDCCRQ
jgi:hypothetical protein